MLKHIWVACLIVLFLAGCAGIQSEFQERNLYRIGVDPPDTISTDKGAGLIVRRFDIAPEFESNFFVYRVADSRFTGDYYHKFMVAPSRMLTDAVREALFASPLFTPVPANEPAEIRFRLYGKVVALYGDVRDPDHPGAVMALRLTLEQQTENGFVSRINKTYTETRPVDKNHQAALVMSWNSCLEQILAQFSSEAAHLIAHTGG